MSLPKFRAGSPERSRHVTPDTPMWGPYIPGQYPRPEHFPKFPDREFENRHRKLREVMRKEEVNCLLIAGRPAMVYVSGYCDIFSFPGYVVFPLETEPILIEAYGTHTSGAKAISYIQDIRDGGGPDVYVRIADILKERKLERGNIGICGWEYWTKVLPRQIVSVETYEHLTNKFPDAKFKFLGDIVHNLHKLKSPAEVAFTEKAAEIADMAFEEVIQRVKPGMKESELYGIMRWVEAREGADEQFHLMYGGPQSARPLTRFGCAWQSLRAMHPGDIFGGEWSVRYGHYCAQTGKPLSIGPVTEEWKALFDVGYEMFVKCANKLRPGNTLRDANRVGVQILEEADVYGNIIIHGVGIADLRIGLDEPLQKGMTIVVEPMPYSKDYMIGHFLADTFVVTDSAPRCLNKLPMAFYEV